MSGLRENLCAQYVVVNIFNEFTVIATNKYI